MEMSNNSQTPESKNFFKKIWHFMTGTKLRIWIVSMIAVIIIAGSVMSIIMATNKIEYSKDLRPYRDDVYSISVYNENLTRNEFSNSFIDRTPNEKEGPVLENILNKLHAASKTSQFAQIFGGQANGDETVKYNYVGYTHSSSFATPAQGVYIRIKFDAPIYVINGEQNSSTNPLRAEKYDVNYEQLRDADNNIVGTTTKTYHEKRVVNAIYIALGSVTNKFTEQTWYLCLGPSNNHDNPNYTEMTYTLDTYGNYHSLAKFVKSLDNSAF